MPADGDEHCGASGIVLASYQVETRSAPRAPCARCRTSSFGFSRKLNLARDEFHTFAVEVTTDHISWFVDTKVVRTEARPEALSGVALKPRFRLQGVEGQTMKPAWMQMDWARYYTLDAAEPEADRRQADAPGHVRRRLLIWHATRRSGCASTS